jgi:hypothetical protein
MSMLDQDVDRQPDPNSQRRRISVKTHTIRRLTNPELLTVRGGVGEIETQPGERSKEPDDSCVTW